MPFQQLNMIFFDIVSACNLRCPFCSTDWAKVKAIRATEDVVRQAIKLAPYTADGGMSLSCRYEPTVHPKFASFIRSIPLELRKKFFFTTNLTTKIGDDLIQAIANSGFHNINISLDTLDPGRFAIFRKNGDIATFLKNFERLHGAINSAPIEMRPKVQIISVALKSNMQDIPAVSTFAKEMGASLHEVRFLYDMDHIPADYMEVEIPEEHSWDWLASQTATNHILRVYRPPRDYKYYFQSVRERKMPRAVKMDAGIMIEKAAVAAPEQPDLPLPPRAISDPVSKGEVRSLYRPPTIFIDPDGLAFSHVLPGGYGEIKLMSGDPVSLIRSLIGSPSWDDIDDLAARLDMVSEISHQRDLMIIERDGYIKELEARLSRLMVAAE